jgi:hypothetical protein
MARELTDLKNELRKLSDDGVTIEVAQDEAAILDLTNVYDELEESEVGNG